MTPNQLHRQLADTLRCLDTSRALLERVEDLLSEAKDLGLVAGVEAFVCEQRSEAA